MSLTEEEANKLWHEMYEQNKIKMGILFATELYQPVNIRKVLDEAKKEFPKKQTIDINDKKYTGLFGAFKLDKFENDAQIAMDDWMKAVDAWHLKWFGDVDE